MGFDVTYHPVSEQQLRTWYFDLLSDDAPKAALVAQYDIDPIFADKLDQLIDHGRGVEPGVDFDSSRGFCAAVAAGIFSRYHYVRGCMLSEVPGIGDYTRGWAEITPEHVAGLTVANRIVSNYSSGVYVAADQVARLRRDLGGPLAPAIEQVFPGPHVAILQTALDEAVAAGVGLLEATDVIEPNPLDLNATTGWSNRLNCDPAGAMLYADTAYGQMEELGVADALKRGEVQRVVIDPFSDDPLKALREIDPSIGPASADPSPPTSGSASAPEVKKKRRWFRR